MLVRHFWKASSTSEASVPSALASDCRVSEESDLQAVAVQIDRATLVHAIVAFHLFDNKHIAS